MKNDSRSVAAGSDQPDENLPETTDTPAEAVALSAFEFPGTARFEVRRRLGSGAFGTVYECDDRQQQQSIAVKVLRHTDPAFLYRFKREFRALVDIQHPNLVQLYELFCEDRFWFFSMELVRGLNFLRYVEADTAENATTRMVCDLERLRETLRQLSEGILALHARGMVHRDIKPANVLVSADRRVCLLDFGLVHELELSGPHSAILAGTPAYMAPERLALQPAGAASDWYSVGVMIFEALTGMLPFTDTRFRYDSAGSVLSQIGAVPTDLKQLCTQLLHPDPTKRPAGSEVRRRLDAPVRGGSRNVAGTDVQELVVGRESELARLAAVLDLTKQGRAVVVNVSGQSGIGKSTVLRAFRRRLAHADPDVVMLIGRCHENESVPFKALDDLVDRLSQYLKGLPSSEAEVLAPRDASSLIRMFPVLAQVQAITRGRHPDVADAEELRHRAFSSLQDLIARVAERKTLVLAIDDLQWGDLDSAAFLRALLGVPSPPAVLVIAAYRAEDAHTSPFLQRWRADMASVRSVTIEHIELGELPMADSHELAAKLLDSYLGTGERQAAESIVREAGGSPFLIEHVVRSIRDHGDHTGFDIHRAIDDRLNGLPAPARRLLETLAIAGQPLPESVACAAAEWNSSDRPALLTVVTEHFVRIGSGSASASRQLEIYHDRLRENIVATMSPAVRQERHVQLASALERETNADPETISTHWREAGRPDRACSYAVAAGDRASSALAFDRAAEWYRVALASGSWARPQVRELQRKLAAALALAGRGVQAAEVYLKAADAADPGDRAESQRLAAEQLLRTGHLREGLAVLEALARELGIWVASTRWQQIVSLVLHRARVSLPTFRKPARGSRDRIERQLMKLDVYWSFVTGLINYDPTRAMDFHTRHLLLAARVGNPERIARSLVLEASSLAALSGRDSSRIRALLARARRLCAGTRSPLASGLLPVGEAFCALQSADWRRAAHLAEEADQFLTEHCSGVAWERAGCISIRMDAAFQRGEWATLSEYAQHFAGRIGEARARGDLHTIASSLLEGTVRFLIADQPSRADQFVRDTVADLPKNRFLSPHAWAFLMQVFIALYTDDGKRAWTLVETHWRELATSSFLRLRYEAIMALDGRARAAIAAAAINQHATSHIRVALTCARKLARTSSGWARGLSMLIRAGVASVTHDRQSTVDLLQRAETDFQACDMAHYVAVCQYRRGMLIGNETGRALIAAAEAWASAQRVVNPACVFDMLAPGRWETTRQA